MKVIPLNALVRLKHFCQANPKYLFEFINIDIKSF